MQRGASPETATQVDAFVCPLCGDGAPVATECVRCGAPLRARHAGTVTFAAPTELPGLRSLRFPLFMCAMLIGAPGLLFAANHGSFSLRGTGTLTVVSSAFALLLLVLAALQPKRGRRRWFHRGWGALRALARPGARRVRGVATVEDDELFLVDGDTRVRVPVDREVRVVGADGAQVATIETGEAIEVVGHSERRRVPRGYRDEDEEVFDVSRGVDVYVLR